MKKEYLSDSREFVKTIHRDLSESKNGYIIRVSDHDNEFGHILQQLENSVVDLSINAELGYLPVEAANIHLRERNEYSKLVFIYNFRTSRVLILNISDSINVADYIMSLIDSKFKKIRKFFADLGDNPEAFNQSLAIINAINNEFQIAEVEITDGYYEILDNFLSVVSPEAMLALLGNELLFKYYEAKPKKYGNMINIISSDTGVTLDEQKAICDLIHNIVNGKHCSKGSFLNGKNFTDKNFYERFLYIKGDCIYVSFMKRNGSVDIISDYYSLLHYNKEVMLEKISKKQYKALKSKRFVILSNEPVDDKFLSFSCGSFNSQALKSVQSNNVLFRSLFDEFELFIRHKYGINSTLDAYVSTIDLDKTDEFKSWANRISDNAIKIDSVCKQYARLVVPLMDFFSFLLQKNYISNEDYHRYLNMVESMWDKCDTAIDFRQKHLDIDIAKVFINSIFDLYNKDPSLFANEPCKDAPFIYINSKNGEKLLCAHTIEIMCDFIERNIAYLDDSTSFVETIINSDHKNDLLSRINAELKSNGLRKTSKGRNSYRIKNKEYFALFLDPKLSNDDDSND